MTDQFIFAATLWTDPDVPITYEFGFKSALGVAMVVQSRSLLGYGSSLLPAGAASAGHKVACLGRVFDAFGVNATASSLVSVALLKLNATALQTKAVTLLQRATANVD